MNFAYVSAFWGFMKAFGRSSVDGMKGFVVQKKTCRAVTF